MKSNFQLVNAPLLSHEGEKADYVHMHDRIRILIYFDNNNNRGEKIPSKNMVRKRGNKHGSYKIL